MLVFQFFLILGILVVAIFAVRSLPGDRSLAIKRLMAGAFALLAVLAIIFPGALSHIANLFGIGRGADLLLYVYIVASLIFGTSVIRAKARSDARVTALARAVALIEARQSEKTEGTQ